MKKEEVLKLLETYKLDPEDIRFLNRIIFRNSIPAHTYTEGTEPFLDHNYFRTSYLLGK